MLPWEITMDIYYKFQHVLMLTSSLKKKKNEGQKNEKNLIIKVTSQI